MSFGFPGCDAVLRHRQFRGAGVQAGEGDGCANHGFGEYLKFHEAAMSLVLGEWYSEKKWSLRHRPQAQGRCFLICQLKPDGGGA
jgi:hypothetical protein